MKRAIPWSYFFVISNLCILPGIAPAGSRAIVPVDGESRPPEHEGLCLQLQNENPEIEITSLKKIRKFPGGHAAIFTPDSKSLILGGPEGAVHIYSLKYKKLIKSKKAHPLQVESVKAIGETIMSGSVDGSIHIWDTSLRRKEPTRHQLWRDRVHIAPSGKVAMAFRRPNQAKIWEIDSAGQASHSFHLTHVHRISHFSFSPDGRGFAASDVSGTIRIWDDSGLLLQELTVGGRHAMRSLAFAPNSRMLAAGFGDGTVMVWAVPSLASVLRDPLILARPRLAEIRALGFSHGGRYLASGDASGFLHIWDLERGVRVHSMKAHPNRTTRVVFSPNGQYLVSIDDETSLWKIQRGPPSELHPEA